MDTPTWDDTVPVEATAATPAADSHAAGIPPALDPNATTVQTPPPTVQTPQAASAEPTWDSTVDPSEYETTGQIIKTGLEGAAEGVAGPLATYAEKKLLGVKPEDMLARREINPGTHAIGQTVGLGASLLTGVGEGALIAKAGEAVAGATGLAKGAGALAKIGSEAINQTAQMALLQGGDEVSKMIINDPNASAQNAISNIGLSAALGGATGAAIGAISPIWKATVGGKAGKFVQEFKDEMNFIHNNPNPIATATDELTNLHGNTQALKESLYSNGIKGDLLKTHLPEITEQNLDKFKGQIEGITEKLTKAREAALESVDTKAAAPYLEQRLKDFHADVLKANTSEDAYNAINDLKKALQKDAYKGGVFTADKESSALGEISGKLGSELRPMLEDSTVWGKAGKIQEVFNKSFSEFTNSKAEKDFLRVFTTKVGGENVLNPGKINTFVNQVGKPNAEIKNEILKNYIEEHGKFADKINGIMHELGKDPVVPPQSLGMITKLMGEKTAGAEIAQKLVNKLGDNVAGKASAATLGGALGATVGHPALGAIIGEHTLGSTFGSVLNGLTKSIMQSDALGSAFKSAVDYSSAVAKGQSTVNKAIAAVFKPGAQVLMSNSAPNQADRDKLDKVITSMQEHPDKMTKIDNGQIGHYLNDHQTALTQTSTQAAAYLAQLKPKPYRSSPLDAEIQPTDAQMQRYHRALDIAQQPAVVMQHIKDGTLQASDIQDLHTMYPSLYQQMNQQISSEMIKAHSKGYQIPYKSKIGISLFLGQPMDSSMTPSSIIAAQPKAAGQPQGGGQQPMHNRKGTNSLGKSNSQYMTPGQASESDRANRNK